MKLILVAFVLCVVPSLATGSESATFNSVPAQIKTIPVKGPENAEDQYHLEVSFGKITEAQYLSLHRRFKNTLPPQFQPNQEYRLFDFLPAFAQEVVGKRLKLVSVPVPTEVRKALKQTGSPVEKSLLLSANCHSISWQWLEHFQGTVREHAIFFVGDGNFFDAQMTSSGKFSRHQILPGDVLVIWGTVSLAQQGDVLHTATYLGDGLVFEKTDTAEHFPYRIAYLKDVLAKYEREVPAGLEIYFRRPEAVIPAIGSPESLESIEHTVKNNESAKPFAAVPISIQRQFTLTEEWDVEKEMGVFTVGPMLPTPRLPKGSLRPLR